MCPTGFGPCWLVGLSGLIAYILHKGFRNWTNTTSGRIQETIATLFENVNAGVSSLFVVLRDLVIVTWNLLVPLTSALVVIRGVLAGRIARLMTGLQNKRRVR